MRAGFIGARARDIYRAAAPPQLRVQVWSAAREWRRRRAERRRARDEAFVRRATNELRDILRAHPERKGVVILLPSADWATSLFQRPQQMALAYARLGYLVFYWVHFDSADGVATFQRVAERLYLSSVPGEVLREIERPIVCALTYNAWWAKDLRNPLVVYELVDALEIFSNYPRPWLQAQHRRLLRDAAVVAGTADALVAELRHARADAILSPNGVDLEHFAQTATRQVPADIAPLIAEGRPIIGYYGALAEWLDFALIRRAAAARPAYHFVLIGPDYDGTVLARSGIERYANITWLGAKSYAEIPAYLAAFDVATIPFAVGEALQAVSPIKLFEYMAGGKPIVTTDLAECRKYAPVFIARDSEEWMSQVDRALSLRAVPVYLNELRTTALANTWQSRAADILRALDEKTAAPARAARDEAAPQAVPSISTNRQDVAQSDSSYTPGGAQ